MTGLNLLGQGEVIEYVRSRSLAEGTEEYRVFNLLLTLESTTFVKAISALAQNLITLTQVRALPAMNSRLMEALIASRLEESDPQSILYRYRSEWFPTWADLPAFRQEVVGTSSGYLTSQLFDARALLIFPSYDFLGLDETKFNSYAEAYDAYSRAASGADALAALNPFLQAHASLKLIRPDLVPEGTGTVYEAVRTLTSTAPFLERPGVTLASFRTTTLAYLASGAFRYISGGHLDRFLNELAYPAMAAAESGDAGHTGEPGMRALRSSIPWSPLATTSGMRSWELARARLARIHLPSLYGEDEAGDRGVWGQYLNYLEKARESLLAFLEIVRSRTVKDPNATGQVSGSPTGLLLLITNN